jgi:hypothetical protein
MDYYASWPVWKMPRWLGAALGGIFTVIVAGCAWLIFDLTRPPQQHRVAATVPAAATAPKVAAVAPAVAPVVAPAPEATPAALPAAHAEKPAAKSHGHSTLHKRAILAKHDAKTRGPRKDELDRLLGL